MEAVTGIGGTVDFTFNSALEVQKSFSQTGQSHGFIFEQSAVASFVFLHTNYVQLFV